MKPGSNLQLQEETTRFEPCRQLAPPTGGRVKQQFTTADPCSHVPTCSAPFCAPPVGPSVPARPFLLLPASAAPAQFAPTSHPDLHVPGGTWSARPSASPISSVGPGGTVGRNTVNLNVFTSKTHREAAVLRQTDRSCTFQTVLGFSSFLLIVSLISVVLSFPY